MTQISLEKFVSKWSQIDLNEIAVAQSHFNDVCSLVGHPSPLDSDPEGNFFAFEAPVEKVGIGRGRADVWYKGKFVWEYKGAHADLDKAYQQLQLYREALGNPPLLITSDTQKIVIHTNFTNTVKKIYTVDFDTLVEGNGLDILKAVFYEPLSLKPDLTQEQVTEATAEAFVNVVKELQKWDRTSSDQIAPEEFAHFIIRLLFCLFAEDMGLLPDNLFTKLVYSKSLTTIKIQETLKELFGVMSVGGLFGYHEIPYFNGDLFDDDFVPDLPGDVPHELRRASDLDWSSIDPSIFGTLFERVIDESKRSQLGAHYTSMEDIMLVIDPVILRPLQKEWLSARKKAEAHLTIGDSDQAFHVLSSFSERLGLIRILDPACGSGNFLYVGLRRLLDLQKEVITFTGRNNLDEIPLTVSPSQLYGIEVNPYAFELAQITIWIGYIQWKFENGFRSVDEPVLQPLNQIEMKDAILVQKGVEIANWPSVDFIIGNPPFLGSRKMRPALGEEYCDQLIEAFNTKIEGMPDLVCYWFEIAKEQLKSGAAKRVGLLATQSIRGGTNRQVLEQIKESGDIFMAWSDLEWKLEGATVHVSIIGFDDGTEPEKYLDGEPVLEINPDLTSGVDITGASRLVENQGISFQGVVLRGKFNISTEEAQKMLAVQNSDSDFDNADVIKPRRTGQDIVHRSKNEFVIDFGVNMLKERASNYQMPFEYLKEHVYPMRQKAKQESAREKWWIHWNPRLNMREALSSLSRYIATPRVSKQRVFVWLDGQILPDAQLVVFAREDDYFIGVLQSRVHELWARRSGTQLRDAESGFRYTSQSTFETFPLPWIPGHEDPQNSYYADISERAKALDQFRTSWLEVPAEEIGITISEKRANKIALTNVYNALSHFRNSVRGTPYNSRLWMQDVDSIITIDEIEELDKLHRSLDEAVIAAYGWDLDVTDEEILRNLLELNRQRASSNE